MVEENNALAHQVYEEAEIKANKFNLGFVIALIVIDAIISILSLVGVFTIPLFLAIPASIGSTLLFITPLMAMLINDIILKRETILKWRNYKYLMYIPCYFGLLIVDILLSFHAIILIVIPPLMAAQYKFNKRDWILVLLSTIVTIPIIVYLSYIFGLADLNMMKGFTEDNLNDINARVASLGNGRALGIFVHYVTPRIIAIAVVDLLLAALVSRNNNMLHKQVDLSSKVSEEVQKRNTLQSAVIDELASVIETRDVGTGEHVKRTKNYVRILCIHLAKKEKYRDVLTPEAIEKFVSAAALHDIGKIAVSDTILLKPGKLTSEEYDKMKIHTTKGGELVKTFFEHFSDNTFFEEAYDIAMYHHEKWDGTGYPTGLKEEEIPLAARIMAIADVYDALVSKRVYKEAYPADEAFDIIVKEAGHQFDPEMIEVLVSIKDEFIEASK